MHKLFDENGMLDIASLVTENPSYRKIMEDGVVTDQELQEQADATVASLRRLRQICNEEQQEAIADAIAQMSVLFAVYHNQQLQEFVK